MLWLTLPCVQTQECLPSQCWKELLINSLDGLRVWFWLPHITILIPTVWFTLSNETVDKPILLSEVMSAKIMTGARECNVCPRPSSKYRSSQSTILFYSYRMPGEAGTVEIPNKIRFQRGETRHHVSQQYHISCGCTAAGRTDRTWLWMD